MCRNYNIVSEFLAEYGDFCEYSCFNSVVIAPCRWAEECWRECCLLLATSHSFEAIQPTNANKNLPSRRTIYQLKHPLMLVCMKNTALGGVKRQTQHLALPRAVFVSRHTPRALFFIQTCGGALTCL